MNFTTLSAEDILTIANPIMDNLMDASTEIDHQRHIRDFTDRMKNIVTEDHLRKVCERYQSEKGLFAHREVTAVFRRPESVAIIYKQYFTKVEGEYVAALVLVYQDDRYLVDHAWVF